MPWKWSKHASSTYISLGLLFGVSLRAELVFNVCFDKNRHVFLPISVYWRLTKSYNFLVFLPNFSSLFTKHLPNKCYFVQSPTPLLIILVVILICNMYFIEKMKISTYDKFLSVFWKTFYVAYGTMSALIKKGGNSLLD